MPIYSYECARCRFQFDEFRNIENSGKSTCPTCGNKAFKIPAIFSVNIFKKRNFADGTTTPDFVRTPKQEKEWLKSQGITYDAPTITKSQVKRDNKIKSERVMESAFKKAIDKCEQGYKIEHSKKEVKNYGNVKRLA